MPRRTGPTGSAFFSQDHGRRGAPSGVSRLPPSLRTTFPVQQTLSTPVLVGVVARAAGKGVWTGACRLCVAGDRASRRRTLMLRGSGRYGGSSLASSCCCLVGTSDRPPLDSTVAQQ